jgi:hypothetical protein
VRSEVGMQWEGSVLNQASFFTSVLHEHCLTQGWVRKKIWPSLQCQTRAVGVIYMGRLTPFVERFSIGVALARWSCITGFQELMIVSPHFRAVAVWGVFKI